jgi:ketosteroid isomerase-like protein
MPEQNIEAIRELYETINRDDWEAARELVDPDIEWTTDPRVPNAGTYRGVDAVRRFMTDQRAGFEEFVAEPERFFELSDDRVLVFTKTTLRPRGSSASFEIEIAHIVWMRDGKVTRAQAFAERDAALEAAGLSE